MRFDWRTYFEDLCQDHNNSRLKQVGKTIDGKEVSWAQIDLIVVHLKNSLKFEKTHRVVDLGCGNGLICEALSPMVHSIDGYDFSPSLIKKANSAKRQSNIQYNVVDLCKIPSECFKSKDIYLLYEVIQHLTVDELHNLFLSISSSASTGARIFMGGIPEKKRLLNFYNTREKYNYFLECEKSQQPHIGKWWSQNELLDMSVQFGWNCKFISQPKLLYTAHYRFDCIMTKMY